MALPKCSHSPRKDSRHKWGELFLNANNVSDRICDYCGGSEANFREQERAVSEAIERQAEAWPDPMPVVPAEHSPLYQGDDSPTLGETLRAMGETIVTGEEPDLDFSQPFPGEIAANPSLGDLFDQTARLSLPEPPAASGAPITSGTTTPSPTGSKASKRMPRTKAGGRPAGSDEFASLFAAGFITIMAFIDEDLLPNEQEATDLTRPLANIVARRIDLAAKLGQDANDAVAFAVAVMSYGVRVGPIMVGKAQESWNARQDRTRLRTIAEPSYGTPSGDVDTGENVGAGSPTGADYSPVNAFAKARSTQWGAIDRDLGSPANYRPAVVD